MLLRFVWCVGWQLVHKQTYFVVTVCCSKFCQVLFELSNVHRPLEDLEVLLAPLPGHRREQGKRWLLQPGRINEHVFFRFAPLGIHHCLSGEAGLVEVYQPILSIACLGQQLLHGHQLLSLLLGVVVFGLLEEPILLLLYLLHGVHLSQKGGVHGRGWKLPLEVFSSINQR